MYNIAPKIESQYRWVTPCESLPAIHPHPIEGRGISRKPVKNVQWHQEYPPENFSFSPCRIIFQEITYEGLIYYPHPETKIGHFQDPAVIEVLVSSFSPQIHHGDRVTVEVNPGEISIN